MKPHNSQPIGYSIEAFCKGLGISRATYYERRKKGRTPKTINMGGRRQIITPLAIAAWEAIELGMKEERPIEHIPRNPTALDEVEK